MNARDMLYIPGPALGYDEVYEAACLRYEQREQCIEEFYESAKREYEQEQFDRIDEVIENVLDRICSDRSKRERFERLLFGVALTRKDCFDLQKLLREEIEVVVTQDDE